MDLPVSCLSRRPVGITLGTHRRPWAHNGLPRHHRAQPCSATSGVDAASSASVVAPSHVVQTGETMSKIASMYNISAAELKTLNYGSKGIMKSDAVEAGRTLSLPAGAVRVADSSGQGAPGWAIPTGFVIVMLMAWRTLFKKSEQEAELSAEADAALIVAAPATQSLQRHSSAATELLNDAQQQITRAEACLAEVVVMRSALRQKLMASGDDQSSSWEARNSSAVLVAAPDIPVASTPDAPAALLSNAVPLPSSVAEKVVRPQIAATATSSSDTISASSAGAPPESPTVPADILQALDHAWRRSADGSDAQAPPEPPAPAARPATPPIARDQEPEDNSPYEVELPGGSTQAGLSVLKPKAIAQGDEAPAGPYEVELPLSPRKSPSPVPKAAQSPVDGEQAVMAATTQRKTDSIVHVPRSSPAPIVLASSLPTTESLFGSPRSPRSPSVDKKEASPAPGTSAAGINPTSPTPAASIPSSGEAQSLDAIWATFGSFVDTVVETVRSLSPTPSRAEKAEAITASPIASSPAPARPKSISPTQARAASPGPAPQAEAPADGPPSPRARSPSPAAAVQQVVEKVRALSPTPARSPEPAQPVSVAKTPAPVTVKPRPVSPSPSRKFDPVIEEELRQIRATSAPVPHKVLSASTPVSDPSPPRARSPSRSPPVARPQVNEAVAPPSPQAASPAARPASPAARSPSPAARSPSPAARSPSPAAARPIEAIVQEVAAKIKSLSPTPSRKVEERSPSPAPVPVMHMQADVVHLQANVVHMQQTPDNDETNQQYVQDLSQIQRSLLDLVLRTQRGVKTSTDERAAVEELIGNLECRNPNNQASKSLAILDGRWKLVYTTSSETLLLLKALDSLPLVDLGDVSQVIDTKTMTAHNKIDIQLPMQLSLRAESTFEMRSKRALRVRFTHVGLDTFIQTPQVLAALDLPESIQLWGGQIDLTPIRKLVVEPFNSLLATSKDMFNRAMSPELDIQGAELPSIWMVTTFLDDTLRITRDEAGRVYVMLKDVDYKA